MAKAAHGEYAAFTTGKSVRYQKNNKLASEKSIPPEVVALLNKQLGYTPKEEQPQAPQFAMPTDEEKARLRAESLAVPENLQREEPALAPGDFEEPAPETITKTEKALGYEKGNSEYLAKKLADEQRKPTVDPDFLESVSIHTAPIADIAQALYSRFGLYTVYLGQFPQADEINPLTGEMFSNYHLGIAYQASIKAQHSGVLDRPAETGRKQIDAGRDASANYKDTLVPVPQTMGEARRADSFDWRTSPQGTRSVATTEVVHETDENGVVHAIQREIPEGETGKFNGATARYDKEEDEQLVQPNFSGKPIIRPDW